MCSSRKNLYTYPMEGVEKFVGRRGGGGGREGLKAKILEAKYEVKLEFPGGRGVQNKIPFVGVGGGVWIFFGTAQYTKPQVCPCCSISA